MSEQQTPRPEDAPTVDALESVAVTESGPAPAATQDGPDESTSDVAAGSSGSAATPELGEPPAGTTESPAPETPVEQVEAPAEPPAVDAPAEQAEPATEQRDVPVDQAQATAGPPTVDAPTEQSVAPVEQSETPAEQTAVPTDQAVTTTEPPAADAPAEQTAVPGHQPGEPSTVEPGGTIEADAAQQARPSPAAIPRPGSVPKPSSLPKPSALPRRGPGAGVPTPVVVAPVLDDSREAAAAAAWGRVDPDGTVWVREAAGERTVGQYTGADSEEALAFYVRRFLDLQAQVVLFETRLPQLQTKEIDQTIATLAEALTEPAAVGDIDGLRARLVTLRERAKERRKEISAEREAAKAQALAERTVIVERAEAISATDPAKVHWRSAGEELRSLLEQWKHAQRTGPRLDRPTEDALWKRFSRARTTFDRNRGHYFSQLDAAQAEAKGAKEQLIAEAEALSTSTDWGRTSASYRELMDRWKAVGRASRKEDDALWARFRAARQRFFEAREAQNAEIDAEYTANLEVKLSLLEQAEALLPVTDAEAAKAALRPIQDRWDQAGKVPRADVQRVEARMRAVEQAVREADQERWSRSDPEKKARAEGAAAQLYESIEALERQLAEARSAGDQRAAKQAAEALEARKAWLDQVLRAAGS